MSRLGLARTKLSEHLEFRLHGLQRWFHARSQGERVCRILMIAGVAHTACVSARTGAALDAAADGICSGLGNMLAKGLGSCFTHTLTVK